MWAYSLSSAAGFRERKLLCGCGQLSPCSSVIDSKGILHESDASAWKGKRGWPEWVHQVMRGSAESAWFWELRLAVGRGCELGRASSLRSSTLT